MTRRPNHALRHAFRTPLLAAASALAILTASPAFADCVAGNGGPRDYLCTGTFGLAQNFGDARTIALQGANMNGLLSMSVASGNIGFSMDAASSIINTQSFFAIQKDGFILSTSNGTIDTNTPSGTGINGSITSMFSWALVAGTTGADSNINLALGSKSTLTGKLGGLSTKVEKNSSIGLTLGGKIYSSDGYGVYAQAQDGAVNIKVDGDVITGGDGIDAVTTGKGAINISGAGTIQSATGVGVNAQAKGGGNISVDLSGNVSGPVGGIYAQSAGGDVTVNVTGNVTGGDGIIATTNGKGAATVTTGASKVTGLTGDGIDVLTMDGWGVVNVGTGGVTGKRSGVVAVAQGEGSVKVLVHGDVAGGTDYGVAGATNKGSIQIDLDAGKYISGGKAGVLLQTRSGAATLNNKGTVTATGSGAAVLVDAHDGSATINNAGIMIGGPGGIAIGVASGKTLVNNTGVLNGQVLSNGVTTVNNEGIWENAAGSYIQFLKNTGTLNMGPLGGTVGVLTVTGDASFGPNSFYNARITTTGNDVILVGGKLKIDGGTIKINSAADVKYERGSRYILMRALGGVTGKFDGVESEMSKFTGLLTYDANNVYLTILLRDFRSFAMTRNQWSVANAIYYASAKLGNGLGGVMMTALNQTSDASIAASLTQLSGDGVVTGAANAALQTGHLFTSVMDDQQGLWRDSQPRDVPVRPIAPFAYAPAQTNGAGWPVSRQNYAPAPVRRYDGAQRWRVWASGFGGQSSLRGDTSAGSANQKLNSYGGALGFDYQMGSSMLIGMALGGSSSAFNAGNATGSAGGIHVGVYSGFRVQSFYGTASLAYSNYSNKTTRQVGPIGAVAGETEQGSFTSQEVRTRLEIGRRIAHENFAVTPFSAIEIAHLSTSPFIERASGGIGLFTLAFNSQGISSTPTFLGLKAEAKLDLGGALLTPWVSLAWRHEWSASRTQTASLTALPGASFVIIGAKPARDAAQVKAGFNLAVTQQVAIFATFEGEFGASNPVYAGKGGMKVGW
ncbi:MAG: autotransporter domain-containing protein [Rhodoblastus sp.]